MPWPTLVRLGFLMIALYSLTGFPFLAARGVFAASPSPASYMTQGREAFQRGAFAEAVFSWLEAARLYATAGQNQEQLSALTQLSQAYQALGQYQQARQHLTAALALAEQTGDRLLMAMAQGSLGDFYLRTELTEEATQHLRAGLRLARAVGQTNLTASILNNLGNLLTAQTADASALMAYAESAQLAGQSGDHALAARAFSNAAAALRRQEQFQAAHAQLDQAWATLQRVEPSHDTAYSLITLGLAYDELRRALPAAHEALMLRAAAAFNRAIGVAQALPDPRAASYALGYLGRLYEAEERYDEALQLTRRALFAAQQVRAPESLYRWQWQLGRVHQARGQHEAAITAYRQSVQTLQSFRHEIGQRYGQGRVSFRESAEPVYLGLVDLLLRRATEISDQAQHEPYLHEARDVVELLKAAELQDYFQDDCVDAARTATTTSLEMVSQTAVVIYPIIIPDRLEILIGLPQGLQRVTVAVDAATLTAEIRLLRHLIEKRTTHEYLPHAQKLYDWLIRPLQKTLDSTTIDTLVFVPDGPLRTIPMGVLHDGQRFLIDKYALAITPGLNLTDPRPLPRGDITLLAAGLSQAVQGFAALPFVEQEINGIGELYNSEILLDQRFSLAHMEKTLGKKPFTIVHIASHGQFRGDLTETFLLTFQDKLTLNRLDEIIGMLRDRQEPIELLTLSACQTAAGDDRAALGLAGVAVKAGARSALATLWYINDQASSDLVMAFYRHLQTPSTSRAAALQEAQLTLIQNPRYRHPGYWAPFLLINNWL